MKIRKDYQNILEALENVYQSAGVMFESGTASASLRIEYATQKEGENELVLTFGQNTTCGQSVNDMKARLRVYSYAIEYGELLKAKLKSEGFTFACDREA
jgi:hypothetical protein